MRNWTGGLTLTLQKRTELLVLPKKTGVLQHLRKDAADVLSDCCGLLLLCDGVLGKQHEEEGLLTTG